MTNELNTGPHGAGGFIRIRIRRGVSGLLFFGRAA
jgi:hypothetical protein